MALATKPVSQLVHGHEMYRVKLRQLLSHVFWLPWTGHWSWALSILLKPLHVTAANLSHHAPFKRGLYHTRSAILRRSSARLLAAVPLHAASALAAASTARSTSAVSALGMLPIVEPVLHSH